MKFKTADLKKLPEDFLDEISRMPTSPLILIKKNGDISYGNENKDHIVEDYDEENGDVLLFSWSGRWRTDVFVVTQSDLDKFFKVDIGYR